MQYPSIDHPRLIALKKGIFSLCKPMVCDDLTGARSFFGNTSEVRHIRSVNENDFAISDSELFSEMQSSGVILWEEGYIEREANADLRLPATTFIAGACDSTFTLAWVLAEQGVLSSFSSVLSILQESGRGQMRKPWVSPKGNLSVSFLVPPVPCFSGESGAILLGMTIVSTLRKYGYDVWLKWPNDIITASGCKCGGLLLEERNGVLLAGLGINIQEAPSSSHQHMSGGLSAVALSTTFNGKKEPFSAPFFLWQFLVNGIIEEYSTLLEGRPPEEIIPLANTFLAWKGRPIIVLEDNEIIGSGICRGLSSRGGLILETRSGREEIFSGHIRPES